MNKLIFESFRFLKIWNFEVKLFVYSIFVFCFSNIFIAIFNLHSKTQVLKYQDESKEILIYL